MTPDELAQLKRSVCMRLLSEIPDEALGELIAAMREILEHYGTVSQEQPANGSTARTA